MGSEIRSQNFDLAKFQEIIPRNHSYGAFLLELGLKILKSSESPAKLNSAKNFDQIPSRIWA